MLNQSQTLVQTVDFAVTRSGILVRCWVWPGNEVDQNLIHEVKTDLNHWHLGRVVMVQDAGFNSAANRRTLQAAGGHFILVRNPDEAKRDRLKREDHHHHHLLLHT